MSRTGHGTLPAARILLVDSDVASGDAMAAGLIASMRAGLDLLRAENGRRASELLRADAFDVVLLDLIALTDLCAEADEAVARLVKLAAGALVIALSDGASVSATMAAMRAGAHDYMVRPVSGRAVATRITELAQRHGKSQTLSSDAALPDADGRFAGFAGTSSQIQVVFEQIERVATATAPVFITGETGTGKDLCAEALHELSPRSQNRLVTLRCRAIPREQMEAELFGVTRGATTGAREDRKGAAELADGGTLFLDEIGELDLSLQGKLLRFLQTGTLTRVGESAMRRADVRVICATRHNPMHLISEKRFREDLFYRLHVLPVHLPPLRQRAGDVQVLARHFLAEFARAEHKSFAGLTADAAALLNARDWPGNVRQLRDLMQRVVVMHPGGDVTAEMVQVADLESGTAEVSAVSSSRKPTVLPMWQQEQRIIEEAIASFAGNVALAAAALELSPSTIYRKRQAWAEMDERRGAA